MNDYAILGNDVTLEVHNGTDYVELLCAKSCSINVSTEQILKTTVGNGVGIKRAVRRIEWGISYSGVTAITSYGFGIFSFDLLDIDTIISGYLIKLTFADPRGNRKIFTGRVFLNTGVLTGNVNEFSDSDFDMIGDGIYLLIDTSDSPAESPNTTAPFLVSATTVDSTHIAVVLSEVVFPGAGAEEDGWSLSFFIEDIYVPIGFGDGISTGNGTDTLIFTTNNTMDPPGLYIIYISYDSAVGNCVDYHGNELESFTNEIVINTL